MATVSSFESLDHPARTALQQFSLLFQPLFHASSAQARREAVAALSQSPHVPETVAFFIACQPIAIAAPFLVASPCLSDSLLVTIARTQGKAHAHAIFRRDGLSPAVVDALVGLRFVTPETDRTDTDTDTAPASVDQSAIASSRPSSTGPLARRFVETLHRATGPETARRTDQPPAPMSAPVSTPMSTPMSTPVSTPMSGPPSAKAGAQEVRAGAGIEAESSAGASVDNARFAREEALRQTLKAMVRHLHRPEDDRLGLRSLNATQEALLVRFARDRDVPGFATVLTDALSSSRWLVERLLLDTTGRQLATVLMALGLALNDLAFALTRFYPQLNQRVDGEPRVARLMAGLSRRACEDRLEAWLKADSRTMRTGSDDVDADTDTDREAAATGDAQTGSTATARPIPFAPERRQARPRR